MPSEGSQPSRDRYRGKVVWFDAIRGFGFISPEEPGVNGGADLFVHFHNIIMRDFKKLVKGDVVEFSLGDNEKGKCAKEVKLIQASEGES